MSKSVFRPCSVINSVGLALTAAALMGASSTAWARPIGLYAGGASGVAVNARSCGEYDFRAAGGACDRVSAGGKWFGGYYLSPDVGAEVSYMRFGSVNRRKAVATSSPSVGDIDSADIKESTRAWTVGLNIQMEMFQSFTNHLRLGWSFAQHDKSGYLTQLQTLAPNTYTTTNVAAREYRGAPYFGAAMSGLVMPHVRVFSGWDFLIDGHHSSHLFSAGVSGEF